MSTNATHSSSIALLKELIVLLDNEITKLKPISDDYDGGSVRSFEIVQLWAQNKLVDIQKQYIDTVNKSLLDSWDDQD